MIIRICGKIINRLRVWKALRNAKADTEANLANHAFKNILVLCYGNIYRSPLVAEYLRKKLGKTYDIKSAGFHEKSNRTSPVDHIKMCEDHQVDISSHRSVAVDNAMVDWADMIVVMDRHNWHALYNKYGNRAVSKVVWLGALLGEGNVEIVDPYGKQESQAKKIVIKLLLSSEKLADRLVKI